MNAAHPPAVKLPPTKPPLKGQNLIMVPDSMQRRKPPILPLPLAYSDISYSFQYTTINIGDCFYTAFFFFLRGS